ncbi:MAG TPA: HAD hydrolase family protein, partial [Intrasporangium sp.]|uniref:HAD family hydrolase n=1 Tax=Intrasporangium sp. TaxID=1925024 RepID=UPI002D792644
GVPFRTGRVLRALDGEFASAAVEAVADLGVDHQVVGNRAAAMVLPAGVTKGTGLVAALADLHHSPRNALAVGDAENDLALLVAAEVGAAVPHSVPSLLRRADLVLPTGPGNGLPALLRVPLLDGAERLCPARHWIPSGVFDDDRLGPRARLADDGPRRGGAVLRQKLPGRAARGAVDHGRLPCSSSTRRATTPSSATCPACSSWRSPSVRRSPSRC